jgi:hypothetical protein
MENMSTLKCDILVVGAGSAGLSAAIASAQRGKQIILVDRYSFTGGSVTACLINTICGLYYRNDAMPCWCSEGFVRQWAEELAEKSNSHPVKMPGGIWTLPFNPEAFQVIADESIREHHNIDLLLNTTVCKVEAVGRKVVSVRSMSRDSIINIRPEVVVDCSGQASVIHLAGGDTVDVSQSQAGAIVLKLENVDKAIHNRSNLLALLREIAKATESGVLPEECKKISFTPSANPNQLYLKLTLPIVKSGRYHPIYVNQMEQRARYLTDTLSDWIMDNCTTLKDSNCHISVASQVGLRSGRCGMGKATLTRENVLNCDSFSDAVAAGTWPIELWNGNGHCLTEMLPENKSYDIPAGCLISKDFDNVFMAGRCISADADALASARVIACSMATGYSAGKNAAEMVNKN